MLSYIFSFEIALTVIDKLNTFKSELSQYSYVKYKSLFLIDVLGVAVTVVA